MNLQAILVAATCMIGFISISKSFLKFVRWVWVTFSRPPKNLRDYGSWALITGATSGIGKAMAFELASKGLNIILIGRNVSELQNVSNGICKKFGSSRVEVKYVVMDIVKDKNAEVVRKVEAAIDGLDVGLLVNNAGVAYPSPKYFHEVESNLMESVNGVNLDSLMWMTKAVLPAMLKKNKGCIVNIGSSSAGFPSFPLYALYAATKSFVRIFSRSISWEYQQHGIDVQCQEPLFVDTKMIPSTRSSLLVPSPEMYSRAAIRWIGYERNCMPYWTHSLQWWIISSLPDALLSASILHLVLGLRESGVFKLISFEF